MAHKRKRANPLQPQKKAGKKPMTQGERQNFIKKELHNFENLGKELFSERTKENSIIEQILQNEVNLKNIQLIRKHLEQYPDAIPFRIFPGGWAISYGNNQDECKRMLAKAEKDFSDQLKILQHQRRLLIEKRNEFINREYHQLHRMKNSEAFQSYE